jgi:hypothetical protein
MRALATLAAAGLIALGPPVSLSSSERAPREGMNARPHGVTTSIAVTAENSTAFLPDPDKPLPDKPRRVMRQLIKVSRYLEASIRRWVTKGHPSWTRRPPRAVVFQALYQQRIYRMLTKRKNRPLARRVLDRLDGRLAWFARATIRAGAGLRAQITPLKPPITMRTGRPAPAGDLLRYYRRGQRRFGVAWELLAAVNFVETKFGRVKSRSPAGARGPMQFLPSTWRSYGLGDILSPRDAIRGAANYLHASGAPRDYRKALFAYNHSNAYVDAVLKYAHRMMRNRHNYFAYYNWQVFVITTKGDVRLTGPQQTEPSEGRIKQEEARSK